MGGLFSPKMPSLPPAEPVPGKNDALTEAQRRADAAARQARGRAATILTSPEGAAPTGSVATRELLGGL